MQKALDFDHPNREVRVLLKKAQQLLNEEERTPLGSIGRGVSRSFGQLGGEERTEAEKNRKFMQNWERREQETKRKSVGYT